MFLWLILLKLLFMGGSNLKSKGRFSSLNLRFNKWFSRNSQLYVMLKRTGNKNGRRVYANNEYKWMDWLIAVKSAIDKCLPFCILQLHRKILSRQWAQWFARKESSLSHPQAPLSPPYFALTSISILLCPYPNTVQLLCRGVIEQEELSQGKL